MPGLIVLLTGLAGYWLVRNAAEAGATPSGGHQPPPRKRAAPVSPPGPGKARVRDSFADGTTIEVFASFRPEEIVLRFPSAESYESFIRALDSSSVRLLDRLDRLRAMRVGFDPAEEKEILHLFEHERITSYKTLPQLPEPPPAPGGASRQVATAFGDRVLPWLGVTGDNSRWGYGVNLAVIDTGIVPHAALPRVYSSIAIVPYPEDIEATHLHGTAVASLVAGIHPMARGIAPAVNLISVRVLDERGLSDSFAISAGLLAAMDAGAEIINLSLGEQQENPLVEEALGMVLDRGIVVVASSGNEGRQEAKYPAAYPGVIGVGAVDASGERMSFSNLGSELGMAAPGYGVNAAAPGGRFISISGTSASAPLVAGAIAATMSDGTGRRISAAEAVQMVMQYADDEGPPGFDTGYGSGVLNLGRIMNRATPGICDAVVTWQELVTEGGSEKIRVTVQNRGTEALINTRIEVETPAGRESVIATTISPCASGSFSVPFHRSALSGFTYAEITSTATPGNSATDITPQNNRRTDVVELR